MLTADLVDARRKDGELRLRPLDAKSRPEALEVAAALLDAAKGHVGERRAALDEAWDGITTETKRPKVALGLRKLAADGCTFEAQTTIEPSALRHALFALATERRRAQSFDRAEIVAEIARDHAVDPTEIERAIFADLRSEHVLLEAPALGAAGLVEAWELGQTQAVLLAAVKVTCEVRSASPGVLRALFAKLKFLQLLFTAERTETASWRIVIDGPFSMFDTVTKYGLRLAMMLPALRALEAWSLVADIRWGKAREPLVFRVDGASEARHGAVEHALHLSDEVRALLEGIASSKTPWRARATTAILDVPGLGVCIPDLELTQDGDAEPVYVEVLGFWSRDAVWRRVELAERGLTARVVFAVSSRLRVSAEVLGEEIPAALYVYKGKMSPRALLGRADAVRQRKPVG